MSHHPERKIKSCLNCESEVFGRYCHQCGQENVEPRETFAGLVKHFFYDITHFDGNFFTTAKYLLFRPGYLSAEYVKGRRVRFLHPIRLYVFTSAVFFLVFFSLYHVGSDDVGEESREVSRSSVLEGIDRNLSAKDKQQLNEIFKENRVTTPDSLKETNWEDAHLRKKTYDSLQSLLPDSLKDGWFTKRRKYIKMALEREIRNDEVGFFKGYLNKVFHMLPQLMFVSLPLYALLLKLVYFRRKNFYYADHAIYSIHLFVFGFIDLLAIFLILQLASFNGFGWLSLFALVLFGYGFLYGYFAMKRFYGQGRLKTLVKYLLVTLLAAFLITLLMIIFFLIPLLTLK